MTSDQRQIFGFSGMLQSKADQRTNSDLTAHALALTGKDHGQRLCWVPTGIGDSPAAVESKMTGFADWRPDVDFGASAGSLCWHLGGPTDSYGDALDPFTDGLGFLPFSNGVHDDFDDQPRRATYRTLVADGTIPAGYASEDGVGLHYVGTALHEAVSIRPAATAWWVEPDGAGGYREKPIAPRLL